MRYGSIFELPELGVPNPTKDWKKCVAKCMLIEISESDCLGADDSGDKALKSDPARQVVGECCGLPLALNTAGRAMSSKYSSEEGKDALTVLRNYPHEMPAIVNRLFSCLEFSYVALGDETTKEVLPLCMPNLRVLKLSDWWLRDLPQAITDLEELRYLRHQILVFSMYKCGDSGCELLDYSAKFNFCSTHWSSNKNWDIEG